jgi:beta-fructofuranosidase
MHIPSGFWKNELGDIDVIAHDDCIHAFYLSIPSHDRVGHLLSRDGLNWTEERPAVVTGDPGDFDDDHIWTMGVFEHAGTFFMLYTGICRKERGKIQRVGLATSKDLFHWTKHVKNPVACADLRWYEAAVDATHRVDWRDPKVFVEDGVMHAVISARANTGPANRRGCAGYFVSKNGYDWEVKPPLHVLGNCYDFETPAILKLKERYYLTGISGRDRDQAIPNVFRVADRVEGPYRRTRNDDLLPGANSVYKPCVWKGMPLYFHNLRGPADWPTGKGEVVTCLPPPKVADVDAEGGLALRPFPCWDGVARGPWQDLTPAMLHATGAVALGRWDLSGGALNGDCAPGLGAFLVAGEQGSVILETVLDMRDAREFGVVLRADGGADDGTFAAVLPATRRVQLYTQQEFLKTPSAGVTYRWRGRHVVQESAIPMEFGPVVRLRVVAFGPYVEVSLDDRVLISAVTLARAAGRVGVFAEDGRIAVRSWRLRPLNSPASQSMCV